MGKSDLDHVDGIEQLSKDVLEKMQKVKTAFANEINGTLLVMNANDYGYLILSDYFYDDKQFFDGSMCYSAEELFMELFKSWLVDDLMLINPDGGDPNYSNAEMQKEFEKKAGLL